MEPSGASGIDPYSLNEILELERQFDRAGRDSVPSGAAVDFEKEAGYVDDKILKVGNRTESLQRYSDNFSSDYWLSRNDPEFRKQISNLVTPENRVDFVWKYFIGLRVPPDVLKKYQKNTETSRLLRDRGNNLYKEKKFEVALYYYKLALMFAEIDSEAMGVAYANRSAVLVELGHFEEAIEDIDLALKNKYPASRSQKLEQRKLKCQESILSKQQEYEAVEPKLRNTIETEMQKMKKFCDEKLRLGKPNPLIPAAAEFVEIKFDEVQGRHLVGNQDVDPGTVLIVEDPYMFTMNCEAKWHTEHCHHCLKRIRRGIPCPDCVFAVYCNELCRMEACRVHRYECNCLPSFRAMSLPDQVVTAIRILSKVGPEELLRLFETRDPAYFSPQRPFGTEPDCKYESESYLSFFHLATLSDKLDFDKRIANAFNAVLAAATLEARTSFFENVPSHLKTAFKRFVSSLMLRHIDAACANVVSVGEVVGVENVTFVDIFSGKLPPDRVLSNLKTPKHVKNIAGALYPVICLMSHSCDPNVRYLYRPNSGTMVAMAMRSLKKGENLLISYSWSFCETTVSTRQAKLEQIYFFHCHCIACDQKWPTVIKLALNKVPTFCCSRCSRSFFQYDKGSKEFRKCVLGPPRWKCGICGQLYKTNLGFRFEANSALAWNVIHSLQFKPPRKVFYECVKLIEYFQHHVCPPVLELYLLQDRLMASLWQIMYFAQQ